MDLYLGFGMLVILALLLIVIYFRFFYGLCKQFRKFGNQKYMKKQMESKKWMGKPIKSKTIKIRFLIMGFLSIIFILVSLSLLFLEGFTNLWAFTTAITLILLYATYAWRKYPKRKKKIKATKENVKLFSTFSQMILVFILVVFILLNLFREQAIKSPYSQIWIIVFSVMCIIACELYYLKANKNNH